MGPLEPHCTPTPWLIALLSMSAFWAVACVQEVAAQTLPEVTLQLSSTPTISEDGGVQTVTATMSTSAADVVTVTIAAEPANYNFPLEFAADEHFEVSANKVLTFAAGSTTSAGTVTIAAVDNDADEITNKRIRVSGTVAGDATMAGPFWEFLIADDEVPPTMTAVVTPTTVSENGGVMTVTATLNHPTLRGDMLLDVQAGLYPAGTEGAARAEDFEMSTNDALTIQAGETSSSGEVTITAVDNDDQGPPTRAFGVRLFNTVADTVVAENGNFSDWVIVEIQDDDQTPPRPENGSPSVHASCDPCVVSPGGEVRLTATASDPDGDRLTYAWAAPQGSFIGATDEATARWRATDENGKVSVQVRVSDGRGGSASAVVVVEVTNEPPAFEKSEYAFEIRENVDGRRRPVKLGQVRAEDPDGDALTYELASGDRERFAIGARNGVVTYVGPGEDFESEPNRYALAVRARDGYGADARARVVVTVTNVNESPEAVDDEAATPEDQRVTVDVLANDADPDGDRLHIESVSSAAHGTTAVTTGRVTYTPELNFHGADRFTYVVSDGAGGTAIGTVVVSVLPVNDAPVAVGVIPDQALDEGGGETTVELTPFFEDVDGDALTFRATSSNPEVATAAIAGAVLTLTPVVYGSAAVTVTAEDSSGLTATQTFAVGVSDRLVREVVWNTLAALARSHLASARTTLGRRVTSSGRERSRLTVLGRPVPLGTAARAAADQMLSGWLRRAWAQDSVGSRPALGAGREFGAAASQVRPAAPGGTHGLGRVGGSGGFDGLGGGGTDFLLAWGRNDEGENANGGRRWQMWGQGDVQTFQGAPSTGSGYGGEWRTGYLGVDTWLTDDWLAGVAVARSHGGGDWRAGSARGSLTATLTAVHPYVQWSDGTTSVWTMAGRGWGAAENLRRSGREGTSGLDLMLGMAEVRRRVGGVGGGVEFGVRADAAWAQLSTEEGVETIDAQAAAVNQTRVGAEVSRPVRLGRLGLSPFGEAHVRRDGGAGQSGVGMEVTAGLRAAAGRVRVDAEGRLLVLHSAAGYRERGVGVTLSVGNQSQEGLSLSLSPRWGDAATGGHTLWQEQVYGRHQPKAPGDEWVLDARGEYGVRLRGGRMLTWFGSLGRSGYGRRFLVGGRIGALGP